MIETDINYPFKSLAVEVTLPGAQPIRNPVLVFLSSLNVPKDRTRLFYRHPLLIQSPILRAGRIEAKIIHEKGELEVVAPWITLASVAPKSN